MSEHSQVYRNTLSKYLPSEALTAVFELIEQYRVHLRISKVRNSKLGDYHPAHRAQPHRISINYNLNKYSFLITLIHEIAHLVAHENSGFRVKPHGEEWKIAYKELMQPFFKLDIFPDDLKKELVHFLKNAKASSCSSTKLVRLLREYDEEPLAGIPIEKIQIDSTFKTFNNKRYKVIEKRRKRYKCLNLDNKKLYLFDPLVQVIPLNTID